jgi:DNA-binding NarL/FixJ family response regulator
MAASVLIVDDHRDFRAWAGVLLEQAGYRVVGEAVDGEAAVQATRRLRPDVVLLDVRLPDIDGFEVAKRLSAGDRVPAVILVSTRDACDYGGRVEQSSALGFLPKGELSGDSLARMLRTSDVTRWEGRSPEE